MKYCGKCGTPLRDDAKFCAECGASCDDSDAPVGQHDQTRVSGARPKGLTIAIASVVVVLVLGGAFVLGRQAGTSSSAAAGSAGADAQQTSTQQGVDSAADATKKAEEEAAAKKKAEEEAAVAAAAKKKAEEEAAAKSAQAKKDAYNVVLDQAGGAYVSYTLAEMSGDDIPELILRPDTSTGMSYNEYPVYSYTAESGTAANVGGMSLHIFRGHLAADPSNHKVYVLESHGQDDYYPFVASVQGGEVVVDNCDGIFRGDEEVAAAGLEFVTWTDMSDRSVIDAM